LLVVLGARRISHVFRFVAELHVIPFCRRVSLVLVVEFAPVVLPRVFVSIATCILCALAGALFHGVDCQSDILMSRQLTCLVFVLGVASRFSIFLGL
jgi:hypothetical protein